MSKNRFVGFIIFFCFMLVANAIAQQQHGSTNEASIVGDWNITFAVSGQTASGTMSLRTEAGGLAGNIGTPHTGPGTLHDVKWSDGKLTTTCVFEQHESILLAGELKDGALAGTFQTEGREGTWKATRGSAPASSSNH